MATESPSAPSRVSLETVNKAVNALIKWKDAKSKDQKPQLLSQDDFLYLVLTLKKIPPKGRTNPYKIPIPNPLHSTGSELCLIIDDRPKSKLTKDDAKKKIKADDIGVSKLLKLSKLKTDYRPFEAKRKLCDSYDMFLADKRVIPMLPKMLGKHFYKKRKIPVPVDLTHKNWKEQIEKACGSALLFLRTGTCSVVRVGRDSMEKDEIVSNVVEAINGIVEIVPKKWGNVRSLHIKFAESLALPVYQALPDMKMKIEGVKEKEEVKEVLDKEGKEESGGKKDEKVGKKVLKKGRIHEVRYMDNSVDDDLLVGGELGSDDTDDDCVSEDEKIENDEMDIAELGGKKRKKGDSVKGQVLSELTGEKPSKKLAKVGKGDSVKGQVLSELSCEKPSKKLAKVGKGDSVKGQVLSELSGEKPSKKLAKVGKGDSVKGQVLSELSGEKPSKKLAKVGKGDSEKQKKGGLSVKDKVDSDGNTKKTKNVLGKLKSEELKVKDKKKKVKAAG